MIESNTIIITDLDGSLLDHNTYSFDAALPALNHLNKLNIPIILSSSKTAAEMIYIRDKLDNHAPFIVENGAGIYLPNTEQKDIYKEIMFGEKRKKILRVLNRIRDEFKLPFMGFNDMNVEQLMALTGLTENEALLARKRHFSEPLKWDGNAAQWEVFCTEIEQAGLITTKGGRFISVSGQVNKGKALLWLRQYYQDYYGTPVNIIALGDSENDCKMLEASDYSVLVRSPAHDLPQINVDKLIITEEMGPLGWNNSIIKLLEQLKLIK